MTAASYACIAHRGGEVSAIACDVHLPHNMSDCANRGMWWPQTEMPSAALFVQQEHLVVLDTVK